MRFLLQTTGIHPDFEIKSKKNQQDCYWVISINRGSLNKQKNAYRHLTGPPRTTPKPNLIFFSVQFFA